MQVKLDVVVFGGRPSEHRSDQPWLEIRKHLHGRERRTPLRSERLTVTRAAKETMVFRQGIFGRSPFNIGKILILLCSKKLLF